MNSDAVKNTTHSLVPEADLHCHILPDWDDGPRTLDESLRMAQRAEMLGVKQILVTPTSAANWRVPFRIPRKFPAL